MASRASGRKRPATDSGRVLDNSNAPYDLSLPQNWNVKKLREELEKLGISYDIRAKKRRLIELYTAGTPNLSAGNADVTSQTTRPRSESVTGEGRSSTARAQSPGVLVIQNESTTSARSAPAAMGMSSSGHANSAGVTAGESEISELHKNVSALQRTVSTLTETMDRFIKNATNPSSSMTTGISVGDRCLSSRMDDVSSGSADVVPPRKEGTLFSFDNTGASGNQRGNYVDSSYNNNNNNSSHTSQGLFQLHSSQDLSNLGRSTYGYSAETLPLVEIIHPTLQRQIVEGKDVNLAALLIPNYHMPTDPVPGHKVDQRLNNVLTISQFIQAFGMYKNIMCKAHPHRRQELDLYERDILDMSSRFGGSGFYEYHKTFSAQAASHLRYNSLKVDWSVRNNTLYCSIFTNARANSCANCGSTLHLSSFCPTQETQSWQTSAGSGSNVSSPSSWNVVHPANRASVYKDILGRTRCVHNGSEVCNNFNSVRGCQWVKCRNLHICGTVQGV